VRLADVFLDLEGTGGGTLAGLLISGGVPFLISFERIPD
jgi:hypothetical protein